MIIKSRSLVQFLAILAVTGLVACSPAGDSEIATDEANNNAGQTTEQADTATQGEDEATADQTASDTEQNKYPEYAQADKNTLYLDTKDGRVVIRLLPDIAPQHVERIKTLTKQGFYDGVVFHRVFDGFMAQTGDPTGTGRGGSELPDLPAEFSPKGFERGVVGMARSQNPNSANSQFFIMFDRGDFLNGQYTVFGEVVEGMEHVDSIKKGSSSANGEVTNPDKIIKMSLAK